MVALASAEDVQARLGRPLTSDETEQVPALLDEASASARAYMRCIPDPVHSDVALVVSRMVARVLTRPEPTEVLPHTEQYSRAAGPYTGSGTFTEGATSGSPWLTKDDKRILRAHGCRGRAMSFETR